MRRSTFQKLENWHVTKFKVLKLHLSERAICLWGFEMGVERKINVAALDH
jgi:hypothetical protein